MNNEITTKEAQFMAQDFYELMNVIEQHRLTQDLEQETDEYYQKLYDKLSKIADRTHMKNQALQVVRVRV